MKDNNFLKENNTKHLLQPMANPAEVISNPPTIITAAEGVRIFDLDGNGVIDAVGGLWNANLGYSCQPIKDAITKQLAELPYYSTFRGTMPGPTIELAHELRSWFAEDGLVRAFFTSGGSDSVDTSLRLARQYHKIRGEAERVKFISFKKGYHGTHWGGASVNGNANFRRSYEPLLPGCLHLPAPYPYRNPYGEADPERLAQLIAATLEDEIAFNGATTIAALIMEPILGAGGVIPPHPTLMPMIREICDRNGILLIADEIITAFGRTGAWTGSRLWGVKPDMTCFAKAVTNAYFPFGGVMLGEKVVDAFENCKAPEGFIGTGYTYSGHPVGAAAALATLEETRRLNVPENAAARGAQLYQGAQRLMAKYDLIGDVRGGYGLMTGIECVADRDSKAPAPAPLMDRIQKTAYENGVMIRISGPNIILSPPLILTQAEADTILAALDDGFAAVA
ncbi:MAG: aminotransferase class III-fold pyridoxal phosphate-dependent enzyme [Pseudorhodobacter sp.]